MTTSDELRAALWRAVGLTGRDLLRTRPVFVAQQEIRLLHAVASQVEALLDPDLVAAAAELHKLTTKEPPDAGL